MYCRVHKLLHCSSLYLHFIQSLEILYSQLGSRGDGGGDLNVFKGEVEKDLLRVLSYQAESVSSDVLFHTYSNLNILFLQCFFRNPGKWFSGKALLCGGKKVATVWNSIATIKKDGSHWLGDRSVCPLLICFCFVITGRMSGESPGGCGLCAAL